MGTINMAFVYLLKSLSDSKKYIGSTVDLDRRIKEHNRGCVFSTKNRRPLILIGFQSVETIEEAAELEKRYKKSHDFLEKMIKLGKFKLNFGV